MSNNTTATAPRAVTRRDLYLLASKQHGALIAAGWTPSALIAAGWTPSDLIAAGWTPSDLIAAGFGPEFVPILEKPYTRLLAEIKAGKRKFSQREFGPEQPPPEQNLCNTPMCTAGSFVSMAGAAGYELRQRYGWKRAYVLLHDRAHPGAPPQNTGVIPDEWALAYIEEMAEIEAQSQSAPADGEQP